MIVRYNTENFGAFYLIPSPDRVFLYRCDCTSHQYWLLDPMSLVTLSWLRQAFASHKNDTPSRSNVSSIRELELVLQPITEILNFRGIID